MSGKGRRLEYVIFDEAQVLRLGDASGPDVGLLPMVVQPGTCGAPSPGGGLTCTRGRHPATVGHVWVHSTEPKHDPTEGPPL